MQAMSDIAASMDFRGAFLDLAVAVALVLFFSILFRGIKSIYRP